MSQTIVTATEDRITLLKQLHDIWQEMASYGNDAQGYTFLRRGTPPTWKQLLQVIDTLGMNTAVLSLFTTDSHTYIFLLRAGWDAPQVQEIALSHDDFYYLYLNNYESELLNHTRHHQTGRPFTHRWRELGLRLTLAAILEPLTGVSHLVIVPAGLYHFLPIHALSLNEAGETLQIKSVVSSDKSHCRFPFGNTFVRIVCEHFVGNVREVCNQKKSSVISH